MRYFDRNVAVCFCGCWKMGEGMFRGRSLDFRFALFMRGCLRFTVTDSCGSSFGERDGIGNK